MNPLKSLELSLILSFLITSTFFQVVNSSELTTALEDEENFLHPEKIHNKNERNMHQNLLDIDALLASSYFSGEWELTSANNFFHFNQKRGFCTFNCQVDTKCVFLVHLYDGDFKNDQSLYIAYTNEVVYKQSRAYNDINSFFFTEKTILITYRSLTYVKTRINVYKSSEMHIGPRTCETNTSIYFINVSSNMPFESDDINRDKEDFGIQFEISSHEKECNFQIISSVMTTKNPVFDSQIKIYVAIMTSFALLEGIGSTTLYKLFGKKEKKAKRVAQGTLALINAFNFFLTFFQVFQFMNPMSYYTLISLPYGVLAFAICPRLIWRTIVIQIKHIDARKKARSVIEAYFWMLSIVGIPLTSFLVQEEIIYYFSTIILVPQILHNHKHCQKYRWDFWIICCMILPKLLFVIYIRGDPMNLYQYKSNPLLASAAAIIFIIECLILLIQTKWPRFGNEPKSPYKIVSIHENKLKEDVCSVCLEEFKKSITDSARKSLLEDIYKSKKMILTPCQHLFHQNCLKRWLKTKSECPNCRHALPIFYDESDED